MTARDTTHAESHNSVSGLGDEGFDPAHDPNARRIVEYVASRPEATTSRSKLALEAGWTLEETTQHLDRLEMVNYLQLVETTDAVIVLLTERGERLVEGVR